MNAKQNFSYLFWWLANIALGILRWRKRDGNIWLFGAWRGQKYSDNPKYLFEYVCAHCHEINAVWITKNPAVKQELKEAGKPCLLAGEKQARKLRMKAGIVFFANGAHDFGTYDLCQGSLKVALWHGMPLKRIFFATNYFRDRRHLSRRLQYAVLKTYHKAQRTLTIATSEKAKDFMVESFELNPESVCITGQPRNDILMERERGTKVRNILGHERDRQFILYMPTWRETGDYNSFFENKAFFLEKVLEDLIGDSEFLRNLEQQKISLYIKPHPNRKLHIDNPNNIRLITDDINLDAQELLTAADTLITDYSSALIDFALTNRPIHFYVPDLEIYQKGNNGLFLDFKTVADFWFTEMETFKKVALNDKKYRDLGIANTRKVNQIYNDPTLEMGHYCENVIKVVVGLKCQKENEFFL